MGEKIKRRDALTYGLVGAAGVTAVGSGLLYARDEEQKQAAARAAPKTEVFKGGAPDDAVFEQWSRRGWAREGKHYEQRGQNVQCQICPNQCTLEPGDRGRCRNKINRDGKLYTLAYANPCSMHIDPIEKKPLFHFLPGTRVYSLATAGCSLRCLNCQNWEISQKTPEETKRADGPEVRLTAGRMSPQSRIEAARASLFPEDLVAIAQATNCRSIAYTYSEPISFYEYSLDSAKLARQAGIKNVWVTNGYINPAPLDEACQYLDAANVDLKNFSEAIYAELNSGKLQPVLDGLVRLKEHGVWFEVTNLIVPRHTDDLQMFRKMADWMVASLGPDFPLHISRFHPQHKLEKLPPTPVKVLTQAKQIAHEAGLRYAYVGNVRGVRDAATTFCPGCGQAVLDRDVYLIRSMHIDKGKCGHCGEVIAGRWDG